VFLTTGGAATVVHPTPSRAHTSKRDALTLIAWRHLRMGDTLPAWVRWLTTLSAYLIVAGGLLAFLWFNVYPARFFMGDTGAMSLGMTLGVIAMLTNSALVLPIVAFPLVIESL